MAAIKMKKRGREMRENLEDLLYSFGLPLNWCKRVLELKIPALRPKKFKIQTHRLWCDKFMDKEIIPHFKKMWDSINYTLENLRLRCENKEANISKPE